MYFKNSSCTLAMGRKVYFQHKGKVPKPKYDTYSQVMAYG